MDLSLVALQKLLAACPHCTAAFDQLDRVIIQESNHAELLHVRCRACQSSLVTLLFSTGPLISSIGLMTDLSQADVVKFQLAEEISEDDVFTLHRWLQQPSVVHDVIK